jgi:hypothetical protein
MKVDDVIASQAQLAMPWGDATAHSKLTYQGTADDDRFERYFAEHHIDREVDAIFQQESVRRLIYVVRFHLYYFRDRDYFVVQTNKAVAKGYFDRLGKADTPVHAEAGKVDLSQAQAKLGATTGGWFGKLKIADVSTAAIFGTESVTSSDEWEHYNAVGELSALNMKVQDAAGVQHPVMLTRDRLILLMKDFGERDNLTFVAELNAMIDDLG